MMPTGKSISGRQDGRKQLGQAGEKEGRKIGIMDEALGRALLQSQG